MNGNQLREKRRSVRDGMDDNHAARWCIAPLAGYGYGEHIRSLILFYQQPLLNPLGSGYSL